MTEPRSDFLREITGRGFLHQCTDLAGLDALAENGPIAAYIGFDCTADSLHVGSLVPIMMLRWHIIAHTSAEALNGDALQDLIQNHGVRVSQLPKDVIDELRKKTVVVLEAGAAADPVTRKVHNSFMAFKKKHDPWANSSERQFAIRVSGG